MVSTQGATKKRKAAGTSDFKRIKAKVGKRALKPANETDTKFRTASVTVGQQNVAQNQEQQEQQRRLAAAGNRKEDDGSDEDDEILELFSTRGRSIEDIVSHLRHPAPNVRMSAARGLKDAVSRPEATSNVIRNHLAVLMPVCAKCCVDEDADVRQLALAILRDVISKVCANSTTTTNNNNDDTTTISSGYKYLKPFIPLLMAHVTSTLNSLDRKTQLDGTVVVGMLSSSIPSFVASYRPEILPAYVVILSNHTSTATSSGSNEPSSSKKDKKKRGRNNNIKDSSSNSESSSKYKVLHSLLALLKTAKVSKRKSSTATTLRGDANHRNGGADLTVLPGGRGINGLFLPGRPANILPIAPLCDIRDLSTYLSVSSGTTNSAASQQTMVGFSQQQISLPEETVCELLGKLRDALAEAEQQDRGQHNHREIFLILEATHLFYKAVSHIIVCKDDGTGGQVARGNTTSPVFKVWSQYIALAMSIFPLPPSAMVSINLVSAINLEVCTTILDAHLCGLDIERDHLDRVLVYLFSELEQCKPTSQWEQLAEESTEQPVSYDTLFDALQRILSIAKTQHDDNDDTDEKVTKGINRRLVKSVAANFFPEIIPETSKEEILELASSSATRKAVLLGKEIILQCNWSVGGMGEKYEPILIQILRGLVVYMVSWESMYLFETNEVVSILFNVVRRLDVNGENMTCGESSLMDHIRTSLVPLFKHKKRRKDVEGSVSGSTFEAFPAGLQQRCLGLIVALQAPNEGILGGLSRICARHQGRNDGAVSSEIASLVVLSIDSVRRTLSMQAYLGFVTNSMGISQFLSAKDGVTNMKEILRLDGGVDLACHILCQCGPSKVLPMLQPLLKQWLKLDDRDGGSTTGQIVSARAAVSILTAGALNLSESGVSVLDSVPELKIPVTTTLCTLLKYLPPSDSSGTAVYASEDQDLCDFLEPLAVFLQQESDVFYEVFGSVASAMTELNISQQSRLVSALLVLANDVRFSSIIRAGTDMVANARAIEKTLSSGSAERLSSRLRVAIEVASGSGSNNP